jgi:acyl carrier protein
VARGYFGRPGLTAERFVADPCGEPGQRMYRTGDLARRTREGDLEFAGRVDDQVKIRGFRVEPAEVQHALSRHVVVNDCAVVVRENLAGERELAAYLTTSPRAGALRPGELQDYLGRIVPDYMVPASITVLDALPLTANGKVDRAALPEPARTDPPAAGPAPAGADPAGAAEPARLRETEHLVARVWAEVLQRDHVLPEEDFFRIGGNSLAAVRVAMRLSRELSTRIPPPLIFSTRTVSALAASIGQLSAAAADRPAPGGQR